MRIRSLATASLSAALLIGAVAPVSAQDDPYELLAQAAQATASATSFHILVTADGTFQMADLGGQSLSLAGTKAEGNISTNPVLVDLTFEAPLGGFAITGALLIPDDGNAYLKLALPIGSASDLWSRLPIGELGAPDAVPSFPPDMAADLKTQLDQAGATLTVVGDAACTAGTCTQLHLELPASAFSDVTGAGLPAASADPAAPAAAPIPVEILIDKATSRVDSVSTHVVDAASGIDVTLAVTLSAYDQPFTVTAPAADQVTDELPSVLQMFMGGMTTP